MIIMGNKYFTFSVALLRKPQKHVKVVRQSKQFKTRAVYSGFFLYCPHLNMILMCYNPKTCPNGCWNLIPFELQITQTHSKCGGHQIKFSFLSHTFSICLSCPEHFQDSDQLPTNSILNHEYCKFISLARLQMALPGKASVGQIRTLASVRPLLYPSLDVQ